MEDQYEKKSWWKRNWKWAVPTMGCLGLMVIAIMLFGAVIFGISSAIGDSQASTEAMVKVTKNEAAIELLGTPIEKDGIGSINLSYTNGKKTIKQSIPVKGPKGTGVVFIEGEGEGDRWTFSTMNLQTEDQSINLLEDQILID